MGTPPDSLDPGLGRHHPVLRGDLDHLYGPGHLCPRLGRSRHQADCRRWPKPAHRLHRRQDLHLQAAQRPRSTPMATPVKASDFAHTIERAIKLGWGNKELPDRKHRRRRSLRQGQGVLDLRHPDRRSDRHDHDQARGALWPVLERARLPGGGPRAEQHADEKPPKQPAARCRCLRDRERRARTSRSR